MTTRPLAMALCAAALFAAVVAPQGATGGSSPAAEGDGMPSSAVGAGDAASTAVTRRTISRRKRIRIYCRKAKRRLQARGVHSESRREARKRKRLCRRRRSRRLPAGAPAPLPAPAPIQPGTAAPRPVPLGRYVSVQAREFSFTLSRPLVGTGEVTIELRNNGEDPHNLIVSPQGTHNRLVSFADHDPTEVSATNLRLQTGRYYLWCSLEGHEAAGMSATLRVE